MGLDPMDLDPMDLDPMDLDLMDLDPIGILMPHSLGRQGKSGGEMCQVTDLDLDGALTGGSVREDPFSVACVNTKLLNYF